MKCTVIKSDGKKCEANALTGKDVCFRHDAGTKREALQASSTGGQAKKQYTCLGTATRLRTPKDVQNLMARALNSLWTGKMPASNPAGALGYLAKIFLEAYEKSELELRLEAVEKRLDQIKT